MGLSKPSQPCQAHNRDKRPLCPADLMLGTGSPFYLQIFIEHLIRWGLDTEYITTVNKAESFTAGSGQGNGDVILGCCKCCEAKNRIQCM